MSLPLGTLVFFVPVDEVPLQLAPLVGAPCRIGQRDTSGVMVHFVGTDKCVHAQPHELVEHPGDIPAQRYAAALLAMRIAA